MEVSLKVCTQQTVVYGSPLCTILQTKIVVRSVIVLVQVHCRPSCTTHSTPRTTSQHNSTRRPISVDQCMAPKRHASFTRASFTPPFTLLLSAFHSTSRILVFYSSISLATQFPAPSPIGSHPHQTFADSHLVRFAHSSTCLGKYGLFA